MFKVREVKVGRNDKCPCGSRRKYKLCCLESDLQKRHDELSYEESEEMETSLELLRHKFPDITFVNVSETLNANTYRTLQIRYNKTKTCLVAERFVGNERVFKTRDPKGDGYDLMLMYNLAYRVLFGGLSISAFEMSLREFFANPSGSVREDDRKAANKRRGRLANNNKEEEDQGEEDDDVDDDEDVEEDVPTLV